MDSDAARQFFIDTAAALGLDVDTFTQTVDDGVHTDYVTALGEEAVALGLPGTPAVLVDGFVAAGQQLPYDFEVWDQYIADAAIMGALEARQYDGPPPMDVAAERLYFADVVLENGDSFTMELYPLSAPNTVNSFVFLADEGWFDGVPFHRVLPGFVAQTGDPSGTGRGGPGYTIPNEIDADLTHADPGVVAMANSGPDTNGSQWYITLADASQLDGSYTIFGRVIDGFDVVLEIEPVDPAQAGQTEPDNIESVTIRIE